MTQHDDANPPVSDEVKGLQEELRKLRDIAARAQADLQNAKIRMEKEAVELRVFAMQGLIERLLPTIDNFQRSFEHLPEELTDHDWVKGLRATEQQMMADLKIVGLERIEALGKPIDPMLHEVVSTGQGSVDTVVTVLENGYALNGKIIRPAKVLVGNGEPTDN